MTPGLQDTARSCYSRTVLIHVSSLFTVDILRDSCHMSLGCSASTKAGIDEDPAEPNVIWLERTSLQNIASLSAAEGNAVEEGALITCQWLG